MVDLIFEDNTLQTTCPFCHKTYGIKKKGEKFVVVAEYAEEEKINKKEKGKEDEQKKEGNWFSKLFGE